MKNRFFYGIIFLCLLSASAMAQTSTDNSEPIEITAVETVEWLRGKNQYVARKDVIVTQGRMQIFTDLLTADYRDGADGSTEIWRLTAEGNVQIKDETNTAYGDLGVYDVPNGIATLTGRDLKLVSPDQTVTATEKMEYFANERKARAVGNATVKRTQDTLKANIITAFFKNENGENATPSPQKSGDDSSSPLGGGTLDRLEADGNVVITTPAETLYGQRAVYRADTNTAELIGKVRVERGENVLEGERAEVNLTTNVSKMYAGKKEGGRVRGVFFPGSEKKPDDSREGQQAPVPPSARAPTAAPSQPSSNAGIPEAGRETVAAPVTDSASPPPPAPAKVSPRIDY